jgi:hypothetical protein
MFISYSHCDIHRCRTINILSTKGYVSFHSLDEFYGSNMLDKWAAAKWIEKI